MKQLFIVQNVLARLLSLRAVQLKQLAPEAQTRLLAQPLGMRVGAHTAECAKLLGVWSPVKGWQPCSHLPEDNSLGLPFGLVSWAELLTDFAHCNDRESWAALEVEQRVINSGFCQHHYVLIPLIEAVHQHAEQLVFA